MRAVWFEKLSVCRFVAFSGACLLTAGLGGCAASKGDDGDGTESSADDSGDGDGDGDGEVAEIEGCDGATLLERPEDLTARGPWPVGARSLTVAGRTTEVWYPAELGSEADGSPKQYDPRTKLPAEEAAKISDDVAPLQTCDCVDGLPLDTAHGPYPVVVYVHGTAAWNTVSLTQMEHWASRGFVVVAMDHPGLFLADSLAIACPFDPTGPRDLSADTDAMLAALADGADGLDFLDGHLDLQRVGVAGHSAGGGAVAGYVGKPGVRVIVPMASGSPVTADASVDASLFLGGDADTVVDYSSTVSAYEGSTGNKALVGIGNAGHLVFSDICELTNDAGDNILTIAADAGVCGASFAGVLFDCDPGYIDPAVGNDIINFTTAAVLEGNLMCSDAEDALETVEAEFSDVVDFDRVTG